MKTRIAIGWATYRLYRQCNPLPVALRGPGGQSKGADMECPTGKVAHTMRTATESAKRARRRTETPLAPYRCAVCGEWHVGQKSGLKRPVKTIYDNHQLRGRDENTSPVLGRLQAVPHQ